jgi:GTP cyclohydrolase IA
MRPGSLGSYLSIDGGKDPRQAGAKRCVTQTNGNHTNGHHGRHAALRAIAAVEADPVIDRSVDLAAAERAAADLLTALGADLEDESLSGTPRRMAALYGELLMPALFRPTTFPNDGGYDELVVARSIPFHSLCEHHLLPFVGVAHVGYLPGERILGLSKLARVVDFYARSLQVQERLTTQIAGWLQQELQPKGVGVVLEAEHLCMSLRGVQKQGATTVTSALHGLVRDDPRTRQEFLALTGRTTHA